MAQRLAAWTQRTKRSALQDMLELTSGPEYISFGLGLPSTECFPAEQLAISAGEVLLRQSDPLQYGPPTERLKRQIQLLMSERGVTCSTSQIFLTAGAQQGISLLARLLLDPGKTILTEEVTYTGFLQAVEPYQPRILTVPTDPVMGIDVEQAEKVLQTGERPACMYVIPSGHNPLSYTLSREKRQRLAQLAADYEVPIIEDDPYGFLAYEDSEIPAVKSFQPDWVYYVGSFSKILAPGLRLGWIVAGGEIVEKLSIVKEAADINTRTLTQQITANFLQKDEFTEHLQHLRQEYRSRRNSMIDHLYTQMGDYASWTTPSSGLFIWVRFPESVDTMELFRESIATEKVTFFPGNIFAVNESQMAASSVRLNFSFNNHDKIEEGITRLSRLVNRHRK
ncbi:aminotransferase-like domain-containing protein [Paenibacillus arenilitoris]|uniref:PLP-dependent aminotransferase family protein n=1 Tax=Paenibacillus arenilitoris TaxID=2772299 RepID=A0A927CPQ5_9BACL|nr:PLP-dependent aminotransferase family protein [Paenibacillus arenilitoris]MBD2871904.1 PLP-dependent aminotransferase family protein [Paenibacillus arenilitoris]